MGRAGVLPRLRHAWASVLAAAWEAAAPADGGAVALVRARALEQAVFAAARAADATGALHHVPDAPPAAVALLRASDAAQRAAEAGAYERAAKRLLAAIHNNGAALAAAYGDDVTVLAALDTEHLAAGSAAAAWSAAARAEAAVALALSMETEAASGYTLQVCTRCKSRDVVTVDKNTRGGDEGNTVFWACNACGHRGKRSN